MESVLNVNMAILYIEVNVNLFRIIQFVLLIIVIIVHLNYIVKFVMILLDKNMEFVNSYNVMYRTAKTALQTTFVNDANKTIH
jgi:hypothetical protein